MIKKSKKHELKTRTSVIRKRMMSLFLAAVLLLTGLVPVENANATKVCAGQKKLSISEKNLVLNVGDGSWLRIDGWSIKGKVKWSVGNKSIIKIDSVNGRNKDTVFFTAKKSGKTNIIAKIDGKTFKCAVTVKKEIVHIERGVNTGDGFIMAPGPYVKKKTLILSGGSGKIGNTFVVDAATPQEHFSLYLDNNNHKRYKKNNVTWTSSDETVMQHVCTSEGYGIFLPRKPGKAVITAELNDKTYKYDVEVKPFEAKYLYNSHVSRDKEKIKATDKAADALIARVVKDGMTEKEIAKAVGWELYMIKNITDGKLSDYRYSAYGQLVEGSAACQGWAEAYMLCMRKLGIPSMVLTDRGADHAWPCVLADGEWYYCDVNTPLDIHLVLESGEQYQWYRDMGYAFGDDWDNPEVYDWSLD